MRAAASSMASGNPSRWRTISATSAAFCAVTVKPGRTSAARWANSRPASDARTASGSVSPFAGSDNGGTGNSCSPATRRGARLETITVTPGAPRSRSATIAAPSITCSKLSSTSSAERSRRCSRMRSAGERFAARMPSAAPMADGTSSGSVTGASGTNHAPSG